MTTKLQLPGGFLFFKKLQIWLVFDKQHELHNCWHQQHAATRQVFIRPRHHSLMVQSQPRQNYAIFCGILQRFRMFAGCSLAVMQDAIMQHILSHLINELFNLSSSLSHQNHNEHSKCLTLECVLKLRLINRRRATIFLLTIIDMDSSTIFGEVFQKLSWVSLSCVRLSLLESDWVRLSE